jgi:hypothetical protein
MRRSNMWFRRHRVDLVAPRVVTTWGISGPLRKAALGQFDALPFTALLLAMAPLFAALLL